ncbi:hypothetical protein BD309DRAFT_35497 [Dichomitus squalens]|nr:hypothetical protein BD309DRAFT_35497 [Dichomitus squalens]
MQLLKDEIAQLQAQNAELKAAAEKQGSDTSTQLAKLEEMNNKLRHTGRENNARAKARFDRDAAEIARLTQQNTELQSQVEALTHELEEVKNHLQEAAAAGVPVDHGLTQELEALRTDKANLEKALADAQAAHVLSSSEATGLTGTLENLRVERDSLRAERDSLLAEKANWASAPATEVPADVAEAQSRWQSERAELLKARDEAKAQADALTEQIAKANDDVKGARAASEKFKSRIEEISRARMAESKRAAEEMQKLRDELQQVSQQAGSSAGASEAAIAKHAEELRALEERLVKKHQEELKAALEAANASAAAPLPDTQAAIDAAVAAYKETLAEEHAKALDDAVERGRKEAAARAKLKDQQLVRAQGKVKELEARLQQLDPNSGAPAPAPAAEATPSKPTPSAFVTPAAGISATSASPAAPAAAATGKAGLPVNLPAKPTPAPRAPVRGRGGAPAPGRGGLAIRGAAPGVGRGAAVAAAAAAAGDAAVPNAVKRTRDGDAAADDTTAKRQKQGEGAVNPPVTLRRNRVPPPS